MATDDRKRSSTNHGTLDQKSACCLTGSAGDLSYGDLLASTRSPGSDHDGAGVVLVSPGPDRHSDHQKQTSVPHSDCLVAFLSTSCGRNTQSCQESANH